MSLMFGLRGICGRLINKATFFCCLALACSSPCPAWSITADAAVPSKPTVVKVTLPQLSNAERSFSLPSCCNCRQLGGLPTRDSYVRRDILFRTDGLFRVDEDQIPKIAQMGWRVVIDLRTPPEWRDEGYDHLPVTPWWKLWVPRCRDLFLPIYPFHVGPEPISGYRAIMLENQSSVVEFFHTLADANSFPIDFHCSAGKDRTGVMAALTLELLGTPRPVIFSDFLYSRHNSMEVHYEDLQECFDIIDSEYGDVAHYLTSIGVKDSTLDAIRKNLIEPSQQ